MPTSTVLPHLERLDAALGRLRRLWDCPELRRRFRERVGRPVEPAMIRTLRVIEHAQDHEPGVGDVATALAVDASTASRLVDAAVAAGYVSRQTSPRDRRRSVLRLTADGAALLAEATTVRTALLAELIAGWPPEDVAMLAALLERLAGTVPSLPAVPPASVARAGVMEPRS